MKTLNNFLTYCLAGALLAAISVAQAPELNLLKTLERDEQLSTYLDLVGQAGLVAHLTSDEQHTVLAPSNEAFEKLPDGVLESLRADGVMLKKVLSYHLLPRRASSEQLANLEVIRSVNDLPIALRMTSNGLTLNASSKVTRADLEATNG